MEAHDVAREGGGLGNLGGPQGISEEKRCLDFEVVGCFGETLRVVV